MKLGACFFLVLASSAGARMQSAPSSAPPSGASAPAATAAAQVDSASGDNVSGPDVPAYAGSLAQGLAEMERLSAAGKPEDALRIGDELLAPTGFLRWKARMRDQEGWKKTLVGAADPVLDLLDLNGAAPVERAAVHYAKGVVRSRAGQRAEAQSEFETARGLAGPGELRLDSIYNLGTADLMEGEVHRAEIPELKAGQGAAPIPPAAAHPKAPGGAGAASGAAGQPPDPLELAQQAYLRAREHFVERLRADWHDADARANTEFVMRRLKELEELKKRREEQKQEQEKQDQQKKDDKDSKKSDQDKQEKPDQDSKDKQDPEKDKDNDKSKDPKEDSPQDQPKPDEPKEKPQDEKKPDDAQDKDKEQKEPEPGEQKEQLLTKEEVMRLLDRLSEIEEKGREMQMQLRHARRAKVKKDW